MNPGSGSGANRLPQSSSKCRFEDSGEEPNRKQCQLRVEDKTDKYGMTKLHRAAIFGYMEWIRVLLERGLDTRARDDHGYTPLHLAAEEGHVAVIEKLLAAGADVNLTNSFGRTALHMALTRGTETAAEFLVGVSDQTDISDIYKTTPLHLAARKGYIKVTKMLLSRGARPHVRNVDGKYPITYAMKYGWAGVARLILASCALNDVTIDWNAVGLPPCRAERGISMLSECKAEIRRMRESRVPESRMTFFDVVRRHPCLVAPCLRVESILRVAEGDRLLMEFPIYNDLIASKLTKVRERRALTDRCGECFSLIFPPLPPLCIEVVLDFLTNDDLNNFIRALEP